MVSFTKLWNNHPGLYKKPCDYPDFQNQCAIRMGVAFELSKINTDSFKGARCWSKHKDGVKHILRAQELANWIDKNPSLFGYKKVFIRSKNPNMNKDFFKNYKGIIFIKDGWGPTDHIDIWNGTSLKGGYADSYFSKGKEIWVWSLT